VGYGDIVPITTAGRVLTICMTVFGTGLFLGYVALFTTVFVNVELTEIEREVETIRKRLKDNP
jgi:hypothetical protein